MSAPDDRRAAVPRRPAEGRALPWWGRLETRVIAAIVLVGVVCVGASTWLARLSVEYFDARLGQALAQSRELVDQVEPMHHELVEAHISAFEARARLIASELSRLPDAAAAQAKVATLYAEAPDVVEISMRWPDGTTATARDPARAITEVDAAVAAYQTDVLMPGGGTLQMAFAINPALDVRYQHIGDVRRDLGWDERSRSDIERAVTEVVIGASLIVLLVAGVLGWFVARSVTRKVTALSNVMARVGQGELEARAEGSARDEIGRLGRAFNGMLDELDAAQDKLAYLQKIGAWQDMARRIAHEIKNPLTPIQLAVQQLREKDPGADADYSRLLAASAEIVHDEIEGLRRMVTSFSQFAKVPEVRPEPVAVTRILEEFERAYGHLAEDEGESLAVVCPTGALEVTADRQLLKQALVNLVENAMLSGREAGHARVRVEVVARAVPGGVEIRVQDDGPGIAPERRRRVFEPYETTRREGTGLGLAIVKKIVLDHGGAISIEDSPLGGAAFVLVLPTEGPRRSSRSE